MELAIFIFIKDLRRAGFVCLYIHCYVFILYSTLHTLDTLLHTNRDCVFWFISLVQELIIGLLLSSAGKSTNVFKKNTGCKIDVLLNFAVLFYFCNQK